jgi:sporulation protein YlmC with PRC-barrel domain
MNTRWYAPLLALSCLLIAAGSMAQLEAASHRRAVSDRDPLDVFKGSELIGRTVRNANGNRIGSIDDLVIDPRTGELTYALVSVAGFQVAGDKLFPVPWGAFSISRQAVVLDVSREQLEEAPAFDRRAWPDLHNQTWMAQIHDHYGQPLRGQPHAPRVSGL